MYNHISGVYTLGVTKTELNKNQLLTLNDGSWSLIVEFIYSIVERNIQVFVWSLIEISPRRSIE